MIFDTPIFTELILPFLLVFVLIFAILQKTKILGEGKAQIDALISLAIGLILVGVPVARDFVVNLMPWLAVGASVILVFLILYGFVAGDLSTGPTWMKILFGSLAALFVIGVVLYISGLWSTILEWLSVLVDNPELWSSIIFLLVIIGAFVIAVVSGKAGGGPPPAH